MPQLAAVPIKLSETEQAGLEKLLRRSSTSQQIAMRAKIILRASEGEGHGEISRALGITKYTSRLWRNRWLELRDVEMSVQQKLADEARCGKPATFTIEQLTQLYALACDPPQKHGRPISHWTPRELADELIKQKIVDSISPRHVGRLLGEADLKPYQSGYWLHPPPTQRSKPRLKTSVKSTN
jgi:putative transposase